IIEMRVHIDCAGCESKVKNALQNLKGVDDVDIEMGMHKVTVTGWADQKKVLKTVRRTGRRAELWQHLPYSNINSGHQHHGQSNHYYNQHQPNAPSTYYAPQPSSSYNYYKHGSDNNDHGYYRHPLHYSSSSSVFDRQTGSFFSDDNPHGCSLM
ncbi:Heavy metal-associated isoprenylated plant protein 28, partial [Linum perenne]